MKSVGSRCITTRHAMARKICNKHNIHVCQGNAVNFGYNVKVVKFRNTVTN